MNNYFTKYIPNIRLSNTGDSDDHTIGNSTNSLPHINYIIIFNPTFVSPKAESDEELIKQIIVFLQGKDLPESQFSQIEQLKLIGLLRGIESLGESFSNSTTSTTTGKKPTILKSLDSSTVMIELESNYFLACNITISSQINDQTVNGINQQLLKSIMQSQRYFELFNKSIDYTYNQYGINYLQDSLKSFWQNFLTMYNSQSIKIPISPTSLINWFNGLNYQGFLGLLPYTQYKKSSIIINQQIREDIELFMNDNKSVSGVLINYFNLKLPKRHGVVYMNTIGNKYIDNDGLIDIYNWLEYNQYHDNLSNLNNGGVLSSNLSVASSPPQEGENQDGNTSDGTADTQFGFDVSSGLRVLNPVNLTNNLVISPINYTVSTVMEGTQVSNWLAMPQFIKKLTVGDDNETAELPPDQTADINENRSEEDEDDLSGEFIIGLQSDGSISRQVIYLKTTDSIYQEHQLVTYHKDDIYVTLVCESSDPKLDSSGFYKSLETSLLNPIIEQIETVAMGGSMLQTSVNSIRSLYVPNDIDQDFFYITCNPKQRNFQSSLPYLPHLSNMNSDTLTKYQLTALYYLHDQLSNIFQPTFFENQLHEFFHKFTSNKLNDWMFYYIKYQDKYIIIMKNKSKNTTSVLTNNQLSASVPPTIERSIVNRISEGVLDYTKLGFLENLGDDVKYWLGTQQEDLESIEQVSLS
ncbi:uncharacterized protein CAALFM_C603580WA [Candida albicans SC5314]|uniref:CCZ1/INTU/HSP4 first Longin domain-containing protein n=1 Tax=Candida albicans (strain SC5314 / ATCC MYA-2876) TaxID=237561 RepID=A0A1D8PQ69_CANAL|nr:uncharacterized protein CAALFM_C603580WA [Candida albicans SC5314]AOW30287.1 hypothetical protein CAALFM_C603580WA [Candida albicans SC5314]|eukprot:XP_718064.2 hypothetical protein CAALFM_C603580WA [Candida albicans SC5314]